MDGEIISITTAMPKGSIIKRPIRIPKNNEPILLGLDLLPANQPPINGPSGPVTKCTNGIKRQIIMMANPVKDDLITIYKPFNLFARDLFIPGTRDNSSIVASFINLREPKYRSKLRLRFGPIPGTKSS